MKLISHRGNINGKQPNKENAPFYINNALKLGYNVEIDIWWYNNSFYLGHDIPTYKIGVKYLHDYRLWCHAKNLEAIVEMSKHPTIHYFWHQSDDYTLTSESLIAVVGFPFFLLFLSSSRLLFFFFCSVIVTVTFGTA